MAAKTRVDLNLRVSLGTDTPEGTPLHAFDDPEAETEENTGIERGGGVTNLYEQETTFPTAGAHSIVTRDGRSLQVDSSNNVRLADVSLGNVGPLAVHRRGMLAGYLDAAWTQDDTIIGIKRVGTVITVDEYNPATSAVTNTRNITFASMPTGLILTVALVKYVDMAYADNQEFLVSTATRAYHLAESGAVVTDVGVGVSFTSRTSASAQQWYSVCWSPGLSLFCAVAYDGAVGVQVMTSPDGIAWTSRTSASAQQWRSVCWSPELSLFCAVAIDGAVGVQVMTSPNGTAWTSRPSASAQQWMSVCWSPELSLFCAVAINGAVGVQIMTSPNGTAWTSRTSASVQQWMSVCWSPQLSLFCAVAYDGAVGVQIMTSPNGTAWTSRTSASAQQWRSVCWSPELSLFCAVAFNGTVGVQVMTSPNGTAWTSRPSASAQQWMSVCWSPELSLFCAVASNGAVGVQVMTSPNGTAWTSRPSASAQAWFSVCWSPQLSLFCAVAINGAVGVQIMTSFAITQIDTGWKFGVDKYLFGRQGIAGSWGIGAVATPAGLDLWRWAIVNRHPATAYSRAILTRSPTQVGTSLIGYAEVGYSAAGAWNATPTGYGPTLASSTATVSNPISAPGYSECTYTRSDVGLTKIYYYHAPDFSHIAVANYASGEGNTHTPINAYGKLTDLRSAIDGAMVAALASLRVCMIPTPGVGTALSGLASYLSAAPISATTVLDHIGVPITLIGELDDTYMPHVDDDASTYSRIIYRFNGNLYFIDIESAQAKRIDKIDDAVYQVNCLSALSIVDTIKGTLELGVNDYNGRTIATANLGAIGGTTKLAAMMKSAYANSADIGDKLITNFIANRSVSIPGIELPTFIDRQVDYGVDVYIDDEYEESYVSRYSYQVKADKQGALYVTDTRLPIAMGYAYGARTVQTEVSTIFTGVGVTGSTDIDYGYVGYELGNDIGGILASFMLYGQRYLVDDFNIYLATFEGPVFSRKEFVCPAAGMALVASAPTVIYFLSTFDNSLYAFNGGRSLDKGQRMSAMETITDGVYSTRDNTLLLQTTNTFIWIRDGVVTANAKKASQTSVALYDTVDGIVIANDTIKWRYTYNALSGSTVVALAWQSAYLGLGANARAIYQEWVLALYNPAPTAALTVTLVCESFDEDDRATNTKVLALNPSDWTSLGFTRVRIQPKTQRALASSVRIETTSRIVLTGVAIQWADEAAGVPRAARSG